MFSISFVKNMNMCRSARTENREQGELIMPTNKSPC
jgi:hypothetical protein